MTFRTFIPYLAFFSLPLIALTKGKGTVILLILLSLLYAKEGILKVRSLQKSLTLKSPLLWGILFFAWAGVSILWSDIPGLTLLSRYGRLLALFCLSGMGYLGLQQSLPQERQRFLQAFIGGYSLFFIFYIVEITTQGFFSHYFTHSYGYNHNLLLRGVVILSILAWPFLKYSTKILSVRHHPALIMAISASILVWTLWGLSPDAAVLGVVAGLCVVLLPRWGQKIALGTLLAGGIAMPWVVQYILNEITLYNYMQFIPTSHQHRIFMWEELTREIFKKPFWGHGFDFASFIKSNTLLCNHYSTAVIQERFSHLVPLITYPGGGKICDGQPLLGIHPHNGFLQIWLELGLGGVLLFAGTLITFYRRISHDKWAVAMLTCYGVIFSVSFNIWQNWMIATLWLGAMTLYVVNHMQKERA